MKTLPNSDEQSDETTTPRAPNLQVVPKAKRRRHSPEYKKKILAEADACANKPGAIGELLRREGLHSSHLSEWRKHRDQGTLAALSRKRGPKPTRTPEHRELERLQRENAQLTEKLRRAEIIISVQKKLGALLGIAAPVIPEEDET